MKESCTCVFCDVFSRNERRKDVCDTYEEGKVRPSYATLRKVYKKHAGVCDDIFKRKIICSICGSSACADCVIAVCDDMRRRKIHANDSWYEEVQDFIKWGKPVSKNFIGHCCEVRLRIEKCVEEQKKNLVINKNQELRWDGYLHFPQLHILIPPPMNDYIDIHGLGKEDELDVPGLLHGVVGHATATECSLQLVNPSGERCKGNTLKSCKLSFINLYGEMQFVHCVIETFYIDFHVETNKKKHTNVTVEDLSTSKVCHPPDSCDVWIIIAKSSPYSRNVHIVNVRWAFSNKEGSTIDSKILFHDSLKLLRYDGLDAKRSGGSNGLTTYCNYNILRLLKTNSAFVRKGKGIKIIKTPKKWICLYISGGGRKKSNHVVERKVSMWDPVQPQVGGQFDMTDSYYKKYSVILKNMTEAKYNSALLLVEVGKKFGFSIQKWGVEAAIEDIHYYEKLLDGTKVNDFKEKIVKMLTFGNKFSMVGYPVGYHYDIFIKGVKSLENKICFSYELAKDELNIGRGGGGSQKFDFALLDHSDARYRRRRAQYVAAGGQLGYNQRLTQDMWMQQFGTLDGYLIQN